MIARVPIDQERLPAAFLTMLEKVVAKKATLGLSADAVIVFVIAPNVELGTSDEPKLTQREREVSSQVAEGYTNREIAEHFSLSERTVEAHISNIFSKIGANSRAQVAAWYARLPKAQSTSLVRTYYVFRTKELIKRVS